MNTTSNTPPPLLLTRTDISRQTGLTERQIAEASQKGRLGHVRIGRVVRHTQAQVDAWIATYTVPASE